MPGCCVETGRGPCAAAFDGRRRRFTAALRPQFDLAIVQRTTPPKILLTPCRRTLHGNPENLTKKTTGTGSRAARPADFKNALGPALQAIRVSRGWSLSEVAGKLQSEGWQCSEDQLAQIEAQQAPILDYETLYFCRVLGMTRDELFHHLKDAMSRRPRQKYS